MIDRDEGLAALEAFDFDLNAVLLKGPEMLFNPGFLGALHTELRDELGEHDAERTLLQIGFVHGLQDALRAVEDAFGDARREPGPVVAPPLTIQLCTDADVEPPGAIAMQGFWPDRTEASARLAALAAPQDPVCYLSAGYTSGWLSGTLDADILALESTCSASGGEACSFTAREASVWRELGDPVAVELLTAFPFAALRAVVSAHRSEPDAPNADHFDPDAAVVHIWGPVMVIPFSGGDEALKAVDLIGSDPAAQDVSVVVVDLSRAIIDDAFGALALEQIVDMIEAWGAEAVFAAVSPLSEPAVAELERQPLVIYKDVPSAISAAFQIADAQRSPT